MTDLRMRRRRVSAWTFLIIVAAIGLSVAHPVPAATASCAGPQLNLRQSGDPVAASRIGKGAGELVLYPIDRSKPVVVIGSNLTFDCRDIQVGGCATPLEPEVIRPMRDVVLTLRQDDREWELARVGDIDQSLRARVTIKVPDEVKPGRAVLGMIDTRADAGGELDLEIN